MPNIETIADFYRNKCLGQPEDQGSEPGHFNVFRIGDLTVVPHQPMRYTRRDYYKISLLHGHNIYHYADKSLEVSSPALLFFNPRVPYTEKCRPGQDRGRIFLHLQGRIF